MEDPGLAIFIAILVLIPFGLAMAIKPVGLWWLMTSWQYRDPEANEPSEEAYLLARLVGVATVGVGIWLIVLVAQSS